MTWFLEALKIKEEGMDIEWSCDVRFVISLYGNELPTDHPEAKIISTMQFFQ